MKTGPETTICDWKCGLNQVTNSERLQSLIDLRGLLENLEGTNSADCPNIAVDLSPMERDAFTQCYNRRRRSIKCLQGTAELSN